MSRKRRERWVVKAGSNMIHAGGPLLLRSWAQQISRLKRQGIEIIWVSSGAIASGVERSDFRKAKRSIPEKQALSAIGQPWLMDLYNSALQSVGLLGAQILLTYSDMRDRKRARDLSRTLETLLDWSIVPILNENDATATEEIRFGDNDALSAKVARMMRADRLVILTDVEGLFDRDPRVHRDASLIHQIPRVDAKTLALAGGAGSVRGTGGMRSKLLAAQLAGEKKIETWLVKGDESGVLARVLNHESIGTRIGTSRRAPSRKAAK